MTTASHRDRAVDLVAKLTSAQRLELLSGASMWSTPAVGPVPATSLANGPNGVGKQASDGDHVGGGELVPATCFPSAGLVAASWDVDLVTEMGVALAREARERGVDVLLGPGLNIKRHPGGGRVFEYFSEDPYLSGKITAGYVRGVQSQGIGTSIKHVAANNTETDRMRSDSVVDERTLREIYLTGFEIAVKESEPWTIMMSYNLLNGVHTGESDWLLQQVFRDDWGFSGLAMTDWMAAFDRVQGVRAGLDLDMPGPAAWTSRLQQALEAGELAQEAVDAAAARVVELALRAHAERESAGSDTATDQRAHHDLARRVAAAGTVLLTNDGLLPLLEPGRLAVIGEGARSPRYVGVGSANVNALRVDSALDAFREFLGDAVEFAPGYDAATGTVSQQQLAAARSAAAAADAVVLILTVPAGAEAEGVDRASLAMPEDFTTLVREVIRANPRTAVVLVNGAPLEIPWADEPAALVEAYLGGGAAGSAIAEVVLGRSEPGGRLAESFPMRAADLPAAQNFPTTPSQVLYRENLYVGYRFHDTFDVDPRFCFGHGLGYTTFEFGDLQITGEGTEWRVAFEVTNTGQRAGSQVAQLYLRDVESTVHRPEQELKGFAKVHLAPGESTRVELALDRRSFAIYDVNAHAWLVEAGEFEVRVGASSRDIRHRAIVRVESEDSITAVPAPAGPVATDAEFALLLGRPVPQPRPTLPFTTDTTINDLAATSLGRGLQAGMLAMIRKQLPSGDADMQAMMTAVIGGMPLRALVTMSGGKVTFDALDRIIATLNGASRRARKARRE